MPTLFSMAEIMSEKYPEFWLFITLKAVSLAPGATPINDALGEVEEGKPAMIAATCVQCP